MNPQVKRSYDRQKVEVPVQVISEVRHTPLNNEYCYNKALMCNVDKGGMYFEAKHKIEVGSNICVKIIDQENNKAKADATKVHYARVKWCKKVDQPENSFYGVGVQIYDTVIQAKIC